MTLGHPYLQTSFGAVLMYQGDIGSTQNNPNKSNNICLCHVSPLKYDIISYFLNGNFQVEKGLLSERGKII